MLTHYAGVATVKTNLKLTGQRTTNHCMPLNEIHVDVVYKNDLSVYPQLYMNMDMIYTYNTDTQNVAKLIYYQST